ncbi:hypothetical protein QTP70_033824 [Hemibagrus guttatus]|uniref:ribonuclease H n=1 Tax=Hemibagrus guttatus TaxID=175788 RepID=A0AAE0Q7B0_9TELE|nr:hypothetical protein QTP70_033824 [Hemibagrus guttatus]
MNEIFRDMLHRFVVVYIDDILIYSTNLSDHLDHVKQVLNRLRHYHLYLKLEKCEFHQSTTQFLGYIISPKGILMDCTKVEAIQSWPQSGTMKDLQRFLGFTNFYRRFITGYSELTAPLTSLLLRKPKTLSWTSDAIEAFQKLKATFCMAPTLVYPDPTRPYIVEVDASTLGVGAVLSKQRESIPQTQCQKNREPILPPDLFVCPITWSLDEDIHAATEEEPAPPEGPEVDRFSKACKLVPLKGLPTALETAEALFNNIFRHFGIPEDIVSDRGPQFIS